MAGTLIFVRHLAVDVPPGLCYGRSDVPCTPDFDLLAADCARNLQPLADALFAREGRIACRTSPLSRCTRLAEWLDREHFGGRLDICRDGRIAEMDFGAFEGRLWNDIPADESAVWMDDWLHGPCPGGESWPMVVERVGDFLASLPPEPCLVVSHGGVWRALQVLLCGVPAEEAFAKDVPRFGESRIVRP